jgi:hypothetical protein
MLDWKRYDTIVAASFNLAKRNPCEINMRITANDTAASALLNLLEHRTQKWEPVLISAVAEISF